jgi:tetratricopeptide (TPR) repeat protein
MAKEAFEDDNFERALALYSRALQYDNNIEEAWFGQIRCLVELRELHEAVMWSDRALERFPNSAPIFAARAAAESRLGRSTVAKGYSDAAFKARGVTPYNWVARGEVLIDGNETNARACFAKAIEMAPKDWTVRAWIGRAYFVRSCHHQALEYLRAAVRLEPERSGCWYWIGKCCESLGDSEEAKKAYYRAISSQPGFTAARQALDDLQQKGLMSRLFNRIKLLFHKGRT